MLNNVQIICVCMNLLFDSTDVQKKIIIIIKNTKGVHQFLCYNSRAPIFEWTEKLIFFIQIHVYRKIIETLTFQPVSPKYFVLNVSITRNIFVDEILFFR